MTLTLHWWLFPLALAIAACAIPPMLRRQGDYDFGTPLIQLGIFAALMAAALGILVGHFLT